MFRKCSEIIPHLTPFHPILTISTKKQKSRKSLIYNELRLILLAERGGFEPPIGYSPIHAFQACDLNHSSISPAMDYL